MGLPEAVQTAAAPTSTAKLADGSWTGYAVCGQGNADGWKPYYVAVTILVQGGKVARISDVQGTSQADTGGALAWDLAENQTYLTWAASGRNGSVGVQSQINAALSSGRSVSNIDVVSGATYSSVAIYNAYANAVAKAASAGATEAAAASESAVPSQMTVEEATANASSSSSASTSSKDSSASSKAKKVKDDSSASEVAAKTLADGTWTGYAACGEGNDEEWNPYYVRVRVVVKNGKVQSVDAVAGTSTGEAGSKQLNWSEAENGAYLNWAANGRTRGGVAYEGVLAQINASLGKGSYPSSIDTVSGATYSSEAIFSAFYAALKKSAAAGGVSMDDLTKSSNSSKPGKKDNSGRSDDSGKSDTSSAAGDADSKGSQDSSGQSDDPSTGGNSKASDDPKDSGEAADPSDQTPVEVLQDGVYTGHAFCKDLDNPRAWAPYYMLADIKVTDGKVVQISNVHADAEGVVDARYKYDASENDTYLNFAINGSRRQKGMVAKIQAKLDAGQDPTSVDVVSSATWSSKAIIEAYSNALASVPKVVQDTSADDGSDG